MKLYVGITDFDWFSLHASKESVDEVNFWRPSPQTNFKVLQRGEPFLFKLGQGSFRALVTDAYSYRCAISKERTLPVLQAAHIRPYADGGQHELSNGLLLRSDLHTLFDQHYLTIEPNKKTIIVSRRIREQFENGRDYYALNNRLLEQPLDALALPSTESLTYHFDRFSELETS